MTKIEKSVRKNSTRTLKKFISPPRQKIECSYFTRKVADELRRRGYRVSLKYGTVTVK